MTRLVQAAHAACEAGRRLIPEHADHPHFVVLGVPDERELLDRAAEVTAAGVPHVLFREADLGNEATAAACGPVYGPGRKLFRKWPLLGDDCAHESDVRVGR